MIDLGRTVEVTYVNHVVLACTTGGHTTLDEAETYHKTPQGETVRLWVRMPGEDWEDLFTREKASPGLEELIWRWTMANR